MTLLLFPHELLMLVFITGIRKELHPMYHMNGDSQRA